MPAKRVLIFRLTAMGDVAMTAPIIAKACKANPDVEFTLLSTPFFEPFFEPMPNFRFVGTNIRKEKGGIAALWRLYRSLSESGKFDLVLDIHDVLRTKVLRMLFRLSGSRVCVLDKGRCEKRKLTSGKERKQLKLTTERYAEVFAKAGLAFPDGTYSRERQPMPAVVSDFAANRSDEFWVGVSPFAQHAGKMYPKERMTQVIASLLRSGVRLFVFGGGKSEKEAAEAMVAEAVASDASMSSRCHVMIGKVPLVDEIALMSNLDVMLSMDSSAMHVCSIFGVRVVSVWGATHPYAGFLGYGQCQDDVVQRDDLDCRPCSIYGNKPCKYADWRCFAIEPQRVADAVLKCRQ